MRKTVGGKNGTAHSDGGYVSNCFAVAREGAGERSNWKSAMKRVLCIRFPHWPLQRLRIARPELKDRPIFLYQDTAGRGARVAVCCETSVRQGVVPGMPLAEALALTERRRGDEETRGRGDAARKVHPPRRAGS